MKFPIKIYLIFNIFFPGNVQIANIDACSFLVLLKFLTGFSKYNDLFFVAHWPYTHSSRCSQNLRISEGINVDYPMARLSNEKQKITIF